jgi:hypothetical protein
MRVIKSPEAAGPIAMSTAETSPFPPFPFPLFRPAAQVGDVGSPGSPHESHVGAIYNPRRAGPVEGREEGRGKGGRIGADADLAALAASGRLLDASRRFGGARGGPEIGLFRFGASSSGFISRLGHARRVVVSTERDLRVGRDHASGGGGGVAIVNINGRGRGRTEEQVSVGSCSVLSSRPGSACGQRIFIF